MVSHLAPILARKRGLAIRLPRAKLCQPPARHRDADRAVDDGTGIVGARHALYRQSEAAPLVLGVGSHGGDLLYSGTGGEVASSSNDGIGKGVIFSVFGNNQNIEIGKIWFAPYVTP